MKNQRLYAVVAVAAMLLATTAISMSYTTQNVFATYKKNQATSQTNACGNGEVPINVGCQNTGSQIQGDENAVALTAQQTFPAAEEVVPPVPPVPPADACRECLELLSDAQLQAVAQRLSNQIDFPANPTRDQIIDAICAALEAGPPEGVSVGRVNGAMASAGIDNDLRREVRDCLRDVFGQ